MQLLVVLLVIQNGHFYFPCHLLAEVQLKSQVIFVNSMDIFNLVYLLETAQNFQELDLTHPFLVDFHLATEKVHLFLL